MTDCVVIGQPSTGSLTPSGLNIGGKVTEVTLNAVTWTALPPTAQEQRNALSVQNTSNINIKVNYSSSIVGYVGMLVAIGAERQYDITDTIILYGKSESGTPTVNVEELA